MTSLDFSLQHEELSNEDLMELEVQRGAEWRQEEEVVTEAPERFTTQETTGGVSLFEEAWLVSEAQHSDTERNRKVLQQPFTMPPSGTKELRAFPIRYGTRQSRSIQHSFGSPSHGSQRRNSTVTTCR